ncbi:hypothetical protein [Ligilactobacillus apodemi]|uniref:Uncharacterized protein n=1 Tax=Ligilactobacillus apodemi DSM 16634 = JCM 16172 TaxID=1423724 RepID=A0A0R1TZ10_9LACO|nr:hypothetical protein [Ligilactobacillus apodemi]KRL83810.1 hypothetical protein FC32_GL001072 [Ligilactobacillus apodemi DSM 16634 = JCM 16172]
MDIAGFYTAIRYQTELVYQATLANNPVLVANAKKQIKKLSQQLMIRVFVASSGKRKKDELYQNGETTIHSYATETKTNLEHDIEILPQAMEGELAKGSSKAAKKIAQEFGEI